MVLIKLIVPSKKVMVQEEIIRWNYNNPLNLLTVDTIIEQVCEVVKSHRKKFCLFWYDGTETCSISDNETLHDAIHSMLTSKNSDESIRIYVKYDLREPCTIYDSVCDANCNAKKPTEPKLDESQSGSTSVVNEPEPSKPDDMKDEFVHSSSSSSDSESEDQQKPIQTPNVVPPAPRPPPGYVMMQHYPVFCYPALIHSQGGKTLVMPQMDQKTKVTCEATDKKKKKKKKKKDKNKNKTPKPVTNPREFEEDIGYKRTLNMLISMGFGEDNAIISKAAAKYPNDFNAALDYVQKKKGTA